MIRDNLQGRWRQLSATENGEAIDGGDEIILTVQADTFAVRRNGVVEIHGTYRVDFTVVPAELDWTDTGGVDAGKTFKSICNLDGGGFGFCAADEGMARPTAFVASPGHTIRWFQCVLAEGD